MKIPKVIPFIKANIISQNGNINIGKTVHSSHTSNSKIAGACFSFGDYSNVIDVNKHTAAIGLSLGQSGGVDDNPGQEGF